MLSDSYDVFLFDLDGVLYRGDQPVPYAAESIASLRELGRRIVFVTNNSSAPPDAVATRLRSLGIEADVSEIETSALTTAELLAGRGVRTAFVVGEEGIRSALGDAGVEVIDRPSGSIDAVVVGLDRQADYAKLRIASVLVREGSALVATNADASFPNADGQVWPGAGALLAAIVTATDARPEVVGKPEPPLLESALRRAGGGAPLFVGDRLDTDIAGAERLGWDSLLVLTGITRREDLEASGVQPTFVGEDLRALWDAHPPERPDAPGRLTAEPDA
jgi:HAD superfamily hydrolase (TIGR01457 family)